MSGVIGLTWLGWPLAVVFVAVLAGNRAGHARRTESLNGALHELRRPLQALALGAQPGANGNRHAPLELAICALADLERIVNGEPALSCKRLLRLRPVIEGCVERWGPMAEPAGRGVGLDWRAGAAAIVADPHRLAQALDNLLLNAIEHGSPPIEVSVVICDRGARITVTDCGTATTEVRHRRSRSPRRGHRAREGRGLRVVAAIAAEHGGRFAIHRGRDGTRAVLELPLASLPLPALGGSRAA